jgi:type I restriction enzyme S subunit
VGSSGIIALHNKFTTDARAIVLGRSGSVGTPKFYDHACWVHNTAIYAKNLYEKPYWIYHMLCQIDYSKLMGGSAVPTLNRNHVEAQKIIIPSSEIQNKFDSIAKSLMAERTNLQSQSQNLARQRDMLLPRLMSGKLEV